MLYVQESIFNRFVAWRVLLISLKRTKMTSFLLIPKFVVLVPVPFLFSSPGQPSLWFYLTQCNYHHEYKLSFCIGKLEWRLCWLSKCFQSFTESYLESHIVEVSVVPGEILCHHVTERTSQLETLCAFKSFNLEYFYSCQFYFLRVVRLETGNIASGKRKYHGIPRRKVGKSGNNVIFLENSIFVCITSIPFFFSGNPERYHHFLARSHVICVLAILSHRLEKLLWLWLALEASCF